MYGRRKEKKRKGRTGRRQMRERKNGGMKEGMKGIGERNEVEKKE